MRWLWILGLSTFGLAMGAASVYGYTRGIEAWLWIIIWVICAYILAWEVRTKPLAHGAATGGVMALFNSFVQILFFDAYVAHNPEILQAQEQVPAGYDAKSFFVMLTPMIALFSALFLGLMTLAAAKIHRAIEENRRKKEIA